MFGVNKNTTTGQVPGNSVYLSLRSSSGNLCIGRGSGSIPDKADILIDGNGAITTTNNILVIRSQVVKPLIVRLL